MPELTSLQAAFDLDKRLADIDVAQALEDAIEYSGMLTPVGTGGDSAMAAANAGKVLAAEMTIEKAVTMADDVIEAAEDAKMAAEDIEDEVEKAAVMVLLDSAIEKAEALKTAAQAIIGDTELAVAVALVEGDGDDPKSAADIGDDIAAAILAAFTDANDRITPSATTDQAPTLPDDLETVLHNRMGMSWHAALGSMDPVKANMRDSSNNLFVPVDAVSAAGADYGTGGDLANFNVPGTIGYGAFATGTYKGIAGTVFCGGNDCKDEDSELTGSWYFTPTIASSGETWIGDGDGSFMVETLFARWGYWVSGEREATVNTFAYSPGNTQTLDLRRATDATQDVTASYTGNAIGIAVRDGKSGHFTAGVNLTATFGQDAAMLGGYISGFGGDVADPNWRVTLDETALTDAANFASPGNAYGGAAAGEWTAQGYGPVPAGEPAVNQRPDGFFGTFNANFAEGEHAAGAYGTP